ncbi:GNAT family N-acetyltransferase [Lysobacter sp. N42]|uniref:GNAT family N-acetyltransferase n=1 Tax=Lysobacter sp. N42 TaxID=2545719 RepID=UPI00104F25B8|nr:GNAT family N-acetyltransferase [Lysobacter sp. N42]TCZ82611.1 N-acetyltransferase [Lysobacter sp. N42]
MSVLGSASSAVQLRLMQSSDAALYLHLFTCPEVMAAIGPPLPRHVAEATFARACGYNAGDVPGHRFWIVGDALGADLGLASLVRDGDTAELGIMLLPEAWDGRRAKPALAKVIDHAFAGIGLRALYARSADGVRARLSRRLLSPYPFVPADAEPGRAAWVLSRDGWARCHAANVACRNTTLPATAC